MIALEDHLLNVLLSLDMYRHTLTMKQDSARNSTDEIMEETFDLHASF